MIMMVRDEEIREEGRAEGRAEGREEGRVEGRAEGEKVGESRLADLITKLFAAGRGDEVEKAGSDEKFLTSLVKMGPKKVVYISCNPVTLERDLKFLVKKGYEVKKIQPVDMFPFTEHVETVCEIVKVK